MGGDGVYTTDEKKKEKRKKEKEKEFTNCGLFIDYTQVYYNFDYVIQVGLVQPCCQRIAGGYFCVRSILHMLII
jgi:hypothetical protein